MSGVTHVLLASCVRMTIPLMSVRTGSMDVGHAYSKHNLQYHSVILSLCLMLGGMSGGPR